MKLLITGSNGLLGSNLHKNLKKESSLDLTLTSFSKNTTLDNTLIQGDLSDAGFVENLVKKTTPDLIINTVGLANVDQCEENKALSRKINIETALNIAKSAKKIGAKLIHISTDHLFQDKKPFHTEEDNPNPINYYGQTKWEAEKAVLETCENSVIVRTNFYGWSPEGHIKTFAEWLYDSLKNKKEITLFEDYYFTPLETSYLSKALKEILSSKFTGIINIAGKERCSKYEFGIKMAKIFGLQTESIKKTLVSEASFKVPRQHDLSMSTDKFQKIFKTRLPNIEEGLAQLVSERN